MRLYRRRLTTGVWEPQQTFATTSKAGTDAVYSFSQAGLEQGESYCYMVRAYNAGGSASAPELCAVALFGLSVPLATWQWRMLDTSGLIVPKQEYTLFNTIDASNLVPLQG